MNRLAPLEQSAWGGFLATHALLWRTMEKRLSASGLSMTDYDVLVALEGAGAQGARMSDLAVRTLMSSGGFTRLADRLARQGLIERRPCETDGRGYFAVITTEGRRVLRRARKTHLEDVRELFLSQLSDEDMRRLADTWERVRAAALGDGPPSA
ncbi:MAG: MarR family winged helix-turn-helix transcriptional regulator [Solirubrobacteraceae bacterium]